MYWSGKNLTKDRKLQKIIEVPFCSPEHNTEWFSKKYYPPMI
jgi:hypothetical protein